MIQLFIKKLIPRKKFQRSAVILRLTPDGEHPNYIVQIAMIHSNKLHSKYCGNDYHQNDILVDNQQICCTLLLQHSGDPHN